MTGANLIQLFRIYTHDKIKAMDGSSDDLLWTDDEILHFLSEGERAAAAGHRRLIHDTTPAVSQIAVVSGSSFYTVHDKIIEFTDIALYDETGDTFIQSLRITTMGELDDFQPDWRHETARPPEQAIHDDTGITLYPTPDANYILKCGVFRYPLECITQRTSPEVSEQHHENLVTFAMYKAYSVNENDKHAKALATKYQHEFERIYGSPARVQYAKAGRANRYHRSYICL